LGIIYSGVFSGNLSTLTCSVTTPAVDVTMPQTSTTRLPSVGSTDGTTAFNIGVNRDVGVTVFVTLTDAITPSNRTNTLTLAADSTATRIACQGLYNNNPISFGPDSSVAGNPGQFGVTASPTTGGPVSIPLSARYIRTGTIQPGTVKGLATFTMSYQ
jgi:type 1 fimbria pilin